MRKILEEGDIAIIDGKEFTTNEIKTFLTERIVLKRQNKHLKTKIGGGSQ